MGDDLCRPLMSVMVSADQKGEAMDTVAVASAPKGPQCLFVGSSDIGQHSLTWDGGVRIAKGRAEVRANQENG